MKSSTILCWTYALRVLFAGSANEGRREAPLDEPLHEQFPLAIRGVRVAQRNDHSPDPHLRNGIPPSDFFRRP